MKNRILAVILLAVSFALSANITAQIYRVDVVANDVWWESQENFGAQVSAVIFLDGQPIPTSSDYYYEWDVYFGNEGYWRPFVSDYGEDGANISAETLPGYDIFLKVTVSDVVNHTFTDLHSEIAGPYNIPGTVPGDKAVDVIFSPKQQNGGNLSLVTPDHWRYSLPTPRWKNGYHSLLTKGVTERIKATPNYVETLQQKLLYWNNTPADILNFHEFLFTQLGVHTIEAQYWSAVGGVTLQNNFLSAPPGTDPPDDNIEFKDPWLVDDDQPPYGKRNQGMSAPFRSRPSPFNPDFTTDFGNGDVYRGVFLNQPYTGNNPVFYSVRAIDNQQVTVNGKSITWDWESWSYDPADIDLQSPNSRTTAVVFKQDGVTLTANMKGRRVSDTPQATAPTNGAPKSSLVRSITDSSDGCELVCIHTLLKDKQPMVSPGWPQ